MTVLVLSQELDPSTDAVMLALEERGTPVFRADLAWFPQHLTLDAELHGGQWHGRLRTRDRSVELDRVHAVWIRAPGGFVFPPGLSPGEVEHAHREARVGIGGVLCSLPVRFVNHPHRVAAAYKPWQLPLAVRCGLDVPESLITNDPERVRAFVGQTPRRVVRKLFSSRLDEDDQVMVGHVRLIQEDDLHDLRGVSTTAHHLQRFVPKRMDARVVVVGERIFAVGIYTDSVAARVDYRADYRSLRHTLVKPPEAVVAGVRAFMDTAELLMASFDFSVDHDDHGWFLECNAAGGQYGWLQASTGAPITAAIADLLAHDPRRES